LNQAIKTLHSEKQVLQEQLHSLQRALRDAEIEKENILRNQGRLENDRTVLKKHLDKVEKDKMRSEMLISKTASSRGEMEQAIQRLHEENRHLARQVEILQEKLGEAEASYSQRMVNMTSRHRAETEMEVERLRAEKHQSLKAMESRERAHRQRVKSLEEQIANMKDQYAEELRKRRMGNAAAASGSPSADPFGSNQDVSRLRHLLDTSLTKTSRDPYLDSALLEAETRRLDDSFNDHYPTRLSPVRHRSPVRVSSPVLRARSPAKRRVK
jgi:hypothetical protein